MIDVAHPWLAFALLPLLVGVGWLEARADGPLRRRVLRGVVRWTLLALLLLALAEPARLGIGPKPPRRLVVLVEDSEAMGAAGRDEAERILDEAKRQAGVPTTAFTFGSGPAAGLGMASLAFEPGERGTVLLLASGHGDLGALGRAADNLRQGGIGVRARALPTHVPPSPPRPVRIEALDLPDVARGPFSVGARVSGEGALDVRLLVDGRAVAARHLPASANHSPLVFEDLDLPPGRHEIALEASPADGSSDAVLERHLLEVQSPPHVLLAVTDPATSSVARALAAQAFLVEPWSASPTAGEAEVVVLDVEMAARLPKEAATALGRRVEDDGLGLLLVAGGTGAPETWASLAQGPFAALLPVVPLPAPTPPPPAPAPTPPEHEIPPVTSPDPTEGPGLKAERRPEEALPISLLLVLDRSASMQGAKLAMAVEGARRAVATLSRTDRVGVITFADDATVNMPMTRVGRVGNISWSLATIQAAGQTDIYRALLSASRVLGAETSPIRHLILLTDGRHTGRDAVFLPLVDAMNAAGITLTAVGLGPSHDEILLKQIAMRAPRGRYVPADTERQIPTILTRDTQIIAERRLEDAKEMARIQDPEKEPEQEPEQEPEPSPPEPEPPSPPTNEEEEEEGDGVLPLVRVRPHEATAGLGTLPQVGPPLKATLRPGSALLLARGEEPAEPVLVAARRGLGRVLVLLLPDDAAGLETWKERERLLVQGIRSVRAPATTRGEEVDAWVIRAPEGDALRLERAPGGPPRRVRVLWQGRSGERDLGLVSPNGASPLLLPPAPRGTLATVRLAWEEGGAAGPLVSYLAKGPRKAPGPRPGDAAALRRALGDEALETGGPLVAPAAPLPTRQPLWPWPLALALLLLPVDVALHRMAGRIR